ncbi:MAG: hypothetical protein J5824_07335 [Lachnospiraceae bacterium]|nr:hypothetical protein [Lachnospiraceae bacterium]
MICILDKDTFSFENTAVTIGKFDALHIGHKALIGKLAPYKKKGLKTVVLRLDIPSDGMPVRSEPERIEILAGLGVDIYIRLAFNEKLAGMSAEDFIGNILAGKLGARALVVGEDFRFGYERRGNVEMLAEAGRRYGFEMTTVQKIQMNGQTVSSSNIREMLRNGEQAKVKAMLGDD